MTYYKTPEFLKPGDKVGIVSPAGKINESIIKRAVILLNTWGVECVVGSKALNEHFQFAGTDDERASDFQAMLDDKTIKAIFCSRGGYGTIRIIDKLNFDHFIKSPKWIVGYSDITIFHSFLTNHHIKSIHGPMPKGFPKNSDDESFQVLKNTLFGDNLVYSFNNHSLNKPGKAKGILKGGNLSIIHSLNSTPLEINTENTILFIEEIGEYHYRLDRMLNNLKISGKLAQIKGLIVGQFTKLKDKPDLFGETVYNIIEDLTKEYNYPIVYDFKAGHDNPNYSLILGDEIDMEVSDSVSIYFNQGR